MGDNGKPKIPIGGKNTFEIDLADYRRDYHQLVESRGLSVHSELKDWINKPITESSIIDCLAYFYGDAPISLLMYFFEEGQLNIWTISYEGVLFQAQTEIKEETFHELEKELAMGLELGKHEKARAPRKRGISWVAEPYPDKEGDLDQIIQSLSQLLFPRGLVEKFIQHRIEHIIIIPALSFQQIPFSILKPFEDQALLIDKWSYSIASSIYDIAKLILKKKSDKSTSVHLTQKTFSSKESLLVGNPLYTTQGDWVLPDLPGAEKEVRAIADHFSIPVEQALFGAEAIIPVIKDKAREAIVLYFATHGIADSENPLDGSGLFFTPTEDNPLGFWTAREIQEEELSAVLVILSACQTGLGQSQDAGVIGLSRAFHLAGAENIIMSLWSVDDAATNSLMQIFMEEIQTPHNFFPSEPLRQAMLKFRKQNPDSSPVFWASFSVMGIPY